MSQGDFLFSRWRPYPLFVVRGGREHQQPLLPPYHSSCNFILTPIAPPLSVAPGAVHHRHDVPGHCGPAGDLRLQALGPGGHPGRWGGHMVACMHAESCLAGEAGAATAC